MQYTGKRDESHNLRVYNDVYVYSELRIDAAGRMTQSNNTKTCVQASRMHTGAFLPPATEPTDDPDMTARSIELCSRHS